LQELVLNNLGYSWGDVDARLDYTNATIITSASLLCYLACSVSNHTIKAQENTNEVRSVELKLCWARPCLKHLHPGPN